MRTTTKYSDDITILNAANMNIALNEIDSNFEELEGKINTHIYNKLIICHHIFSPIR